jgi:hypothetical protein
MIARTHASSSARTLLEHVVVGGAQALDEFHNRRMFWHGDDERLTFVEFARRLASGVDERLAPEITSRVCEQFSRLPRCQKVFAASLTQLNAVPHGNSLHEDRLVVEIVMRLARIRARRVRADLLRSTNQTRYRWRVNGGALTVLVPKSVANSGKWLESLVPDADAKRPGEQERVQAEIDEQHVGGVPINSVTLEDSLPPPYLACETFTLAPLVADEKAEKIDEQRRAIRALGPERLRELVLDIFTHAEGDGHVPSLIAARHGIDPATFSRFAGRFRPGVIPDLWRNVATLAAARGDVHEMLTTAGVLQPIMEQLR